MMRRLIYVGSMKAVSKTTGLPTVERGRGCWNCRHYNTDEMTRNHYYMKTAQDRRHRAILRRDGADDAVSIVKIARTAGALCQQGFTGEQAIEMAIAAQGDVSPATAETVRMAQQDDTNMRVFDNAVNQGLIGLCMKGGVDTDFVTHAYLCPKWTGIDGASVATEGHTLDKLPEELKDE